MILDTSVLVALLREEPETAWIVPILLDNPGKLKLSVANYLEAAIVIDRNDDAILQERLDRVLTHFDVTFVSVSKHHAIVAREAYQRFGKGNHPAKLNYGDCFAYALAFTTGEPLLFKGNDFDRTDIVSGRRFGARAF